MAMLFSQSSTRSLRISKSSRIFAASFSTALPPPRPKLRSLTSSFQDAPSSRATKFCQTRSEFTSTKVYRQQEAAEPAVSALETPVSDLASGLSDQPMTLDEGSRQVDWSRSFHGLSAEAFPKEAAATLLAPLSPDDIEVKPDGILYLPEIKYRRILNLAFGPGAWGLAPRGETIVTSKAVTREYALVVLGRLVSVARGEQDYFSPEGIPTAAEGCRSNALTRCCKDLGIASELWDPRFIRKFQKEHIRELWVEHATTKRKRKHYMRKDDKLPYPWKESKPM